MSYYSGKNILISGAASGIGKLMAMEMGKLGGNMLLLDIDALGLESLKNEMAEKNIHSKFFICDLSPFLFFNEYLLTFIRISELIIC